MSLAVKLALMMSAYSPRLQQTTWNPADFSGAITLSNADLTASVVSNSGGIRGTTSKSAGKWSIRYTVVGLSGFLARLGLIGATSNMQGSSSPLDGLTWQNDGLLKIASGVSGTVIDSYGVGDVLDEVYDLTNKKFWGRVNGGDWNASPSADPATGVGGVSYTASTPLFPNAGYGSGSTSSVTLDPFHALGLPGIRSWDQGT